MAPYLHLQYLLSISYSYHLNSFHVVTLNGCCSIHLTRIS